MKGINTCLLTFMERKNNMPNPLGKKEAFFQSKGGMKKPPGGQPPPVDQSGPKPPPMPPTFHKAASKRGDPAIRKLLVSLIGVKKSNEKVIGKSSVPKQNVNSASTKNGSIKGQR